MAEKTEDATPKRLQDAAKKGQVSRAQDLPSALTFLTSLLLTLGFSGYIFKLLANYIRDIFNYIPLLETNSGYFQSYLREGFLIILKTSLPIAGLTALVGVLINFLIIGPVFATEVFKPDMQRFNPVENLKAKFKLKTLVELIKSLVKIIIATYIMYGIIKELMDDIRKSPTFPQPLGYAYLFGIFLKRVALKIGIFFLAVGLLDLLYQKRTFAKEMMMEKYEVKQEYKDQEGDPHIKGRRKEIAREIAYSEGPSLARKAKAIVTNPTHIAVAIKFEPDEGDLAPIILTKGKGEMAAQIIKVAEKYDIPIMRNVSLAHDLFDNGEINQYIPENTFEAMAEIIRWVASLKEEGPSE